MKIHRFFVSDALPEVGAECAISDARVARHATQVLQLRPGERIEIFNTDRTVQAEIVRATKDGLFVIVLGDVPRKAEYDVTLYQAIVKGDAFDTIVEKATELGVRRIVPMVSGRTIKTDVRVDRLMRIATEAAEQCGRSVIPEIVSPISFSLACAEAAKSKCFLVCDTADTTPYFFDAPVFPVSVFIGPEGGWTDKERDMFRAHNARFVSLGNTVLRADTAATVAVFLSLYGVHRV